MTLKQLRILAADHERLARVCENNGAVLDRMKQDFPASTQRRRAQFHAAAATQLRGLAEEFPQMFTSQND